MGRLIAVGLGVLFVGASSNAAPTAQDVQDAILGRRVFTVEELQAMDTNGDGKVDAADLVAMGNLVVATFASPSSQVEEGDATAGVQVDLSRAYYGRIRYRVRQLPTGAGSTHEFMANGDRVEIPFPAADDAVVEDARTFEIALLASPGYVLGRTIFHTLVLEDNDALWHGSFQSSGLSVHFRMAIVRSGGATTGAIVTDGFGIIPLNGESGEWPASVALDDANFDAEARGILLPGEASQTGIAMERQLRFEAIAGRGEDSVDPTGLISGTVEETVTCATAPYLNRSITGRFTLQRRIPNVVAPDPVLADAPQ